MVDTNVNISRLTDLPYYNQENVGHIQNMISEIDSSNNYSVHLLVSRYGIGKTTALLCILDKGDIFFMGSSSQLKSKIKNFRKINRKISPNNKIPKYNFLCGRLRFLGYEWDGQGKLKTTDFYPSHCYYLDYNGDINRSSLYIERNKPYIQDIVNDIEKYGLKTAWYYHSDKEIIKLYGKMWNPELRKKIVTFAPSNLIAPIREMDITGPTGDICIDEGGEDKKNGRNLPKLYDIASKLIQEDPSSSNVDITNNKKSTIKNFKIELNNQFINQAKVKRATRDLLRLLDDFYQSIISMDSIRTNNSGKKIVDFYISDLVSKKQWDDVFLNKPGGFCDITKKQGNHRIVDTELKENGDIASIDFLSELMKWHDILKSADGTKLLAIVDGKEVERIEIEKNIYVDIFDMASRPDSSVFIPHASLGKNYLEFIHQELIPDRNSNVIHGKTRRPQKANIVGESMDISTLDPDNLKTEHRQYSWNDGAMRKSSYLTQDYRLLTDIIEGMADTTVITPKRGKRFQDNKTKLIEDYYDNTNYFNLAIAEGESVQSNYLHVHGSSRIGHSNLWRPIFSQYKELLPDSLNLSEIIRTDEGVQRGYYNPEEVFENFNWDKNISFNPLQDYFQRQIERDILEKLFRKRDQAYTDGIVFRLGIDPILELKGKKAYNFIENYCGNQYDLMADLIKEMSFWEKIEFIHRTDITGTVAEKLYSRFKQDKLIGYIEIKKSARMSSLQLVENELTIEKVYELNKEEDGAVSWEKAVSELPFEVPKATSIANNWNGNWLQFENHHRKDKETKVTSKLF